MHKIVQRFTTGKGVPIQFIKEYLTFSGDDSPISKLMLSVMGAIHEFERALIKERQLEGIALAKKRGAFKGRNNRYLKRKFQNFANRITARDELKRWLPREFTISRETIYKYLNSSLLLVNEMPRPALISCSACNSCCEPLITWRV